MILDLSNSIRMLVEISEQNSFLVVRSTKDFVIVQIELVTHTKPVSALLTRKALQVVDVGPGSHHHLEGGDHLVAGRAVARGAKQPEIVPLAEEEVPLGVQTVAHLAQPGVAAAALEAVLVPEHVQGL